MAIIAIWALLIVGLFLLLLTPIPWFEILRSVTDSAGFGRAIFMLVMFILLGGGSLILSWRLRRWLKNHQPLILSRRGKRYRYPPQTEKQWNRTLHSLAARHRVSLELRQPQGRQRSFNHYLMLSVRVSALPGEFQILRESMIDKLAKQLGISREHQTGDRFFDDKHYLISDLPEGMESLLQHSLIRLAIKNLLDIGFVQLRYMDGTLHAMGPRKSDLFTFKKEPEFKPIERAMVLQGLRQLRYLANRINRLHQHGTHTTRPEDQAVGGLFAGAYLPKSAEKQLTSRQPVFVTHRKVVMLTPIIALVLGGIYWGGKHLLLDNTYPLIDTKGFMQWTLISGSVMLGIWLFTAIAILSGRSRSHKEILLGVSISLLGFPTLTSAVIAWTNITLDNSAPILHTIFVTEKGISQSRRSGNTYWVRFKSAPDEDPQKIKLPENIWSQLQPDRATEILVHPGFWQWPWLEGLSTKTSFEALQSNTE